MLYINVIYLIIVICVSENTLNVLSNELTEESNKSPKIDENHVLPSFLLSNNHTAKNDSSNNDYHNIVFNSRGMYLKLFQPREQSILDVNSIEIEYFGNYKFISSVFHLNAWDLLACLDDNNIIYIFDLNDNIQIIEYKVNVILDEINFIHGYGYTHALLGNSKSNFKIFELDLALMIIKEINLDSHKDVISYMISNENYFPLHIPYFKAYLTDSYSLTNSKIKCLPNLCLYLKNDILEAIRQNEVLFTIKIENITNYELFTYHHINMAAIATNDKIYIYNLESVSIEQTIDFTADLIKSIPSPTLTDESLAIFGKEIQIWSPHTNCLHNFYRMVKKMGLPETSLPIKSSTSYIINSQNSRLLFLDANNKVFEIYLIFYISPLSNCFNGMISTFFDIISSIEHQSITQKIILHSIEYDILNNSVKRTDDHIFINKRNIYTNIELINESIEMSSEIFSFNSEITWRYPLVTLSNLNDHMISIYDKKNMANNITEILDSALFLDKNEIINVTLKFHNDIYIKEADCTCTITSSIDDINIDKFLNNLIFKDDNSYILSEKIFEKNVHIHTLISPALTNYSELIDSSKNNTLMSQFRIKIFNCLSQLNVNLDNLNLNHLISLNSLEAITLENSVFDSIDIYSLDQLSSIAGFPSNVSTLLDVNSTQETDIQVTTNILNARNIISPRLREKLNKIISLDSQLNVTLYFEDLNADTIICEKINNIAYPYDFLLINKEQDWNSPITFENIIFTDLITSIINDKYKCSDFASLTEIEKIGPVEMVSFNATAKYSIKSLTSNYIDNAPIWMYKMNLDEMETNLIKLKLAIKKGDFPSNRVFVETVETSHGLFIDNQNLNEFMDDTLNINMFNFPNNYQVNFCSIGKVNDYSFDELIQIDTESGGDNVQYFPDSDILFNNLTIERAQVFNCSQTSLLYSLISDDINSFDAKDLQVKFLEVNKINNILSDQLIVKSKMNKYIELDDLKIDEISTKSLNTNKLQNLNSSRLNGIIKITDEVYLNYVYLTSSIATSLTIIQFNNEYLTNIFDNILTNNSIQEISIKDADKFTVDKIIINNNNNDNSYYINSSFIQFYYLIINGDISDAKKYNICLIDDINSCGPMLFNSSLEANFIINKNILTSNLNYILNHSNSLQEWNILFKNGVQKLNRKINMDSVELGNIFTNPTIGNLNILPANNLNKECKASDLGESILIRSNVRLNLNKGIDIKKYSNRFDPSNLDKGVPLDDFVWLNNYNEYINVSIICDECDFNNLIAGHVHAESTINNVDLIETANAINL